MPRFSKDMVNRPYYPVVFMVVISFVFLGILAAFYRSTEKRVEEYKQIRYKQMILSLFADSLSTLTGIPKDAFISQENVLSNFNKYIKTLKLEKFELKTINPVYFRVQTTSDNILGFCFDLSGSGLWGTMRCLLATSADINKIINFTVYEQMETPGLGARIQEAWFQNQFSRKPLPSIEKGASYTLVPENAEAAEYQIKQVTGATITSASILKILGSASEEINHVVQEVKQ